MVYGGGGVKKSVLTRLLCIKFDEIYMHYSNAEQNGLFRNGCTLSKLDVYRSTQKSKNTLRSIKGIFFFESDLFSTCILSYLGYQLIIIHFGG